MAWRRCSQAETWPSNVAQLCKHCWDCLLKLRIHRFAQHYNHAQLCYDCWEVLSCENHLYWIGFNCFWKRIFIAVLDLKSIFSLVNLLKWLFFIFQEARQRAARRTNNLQAYVDWFNRLSYLVATTVCQRKKKKLRVKTIEFWIEVARECVNIGNFNSLMGIITGLNMIPVARLKRTWTKIQVCKINGFFFLEIFYLFCNIFS